MSNHIGAGATFSPDKKYRFTLWRRWDLNRPMAMFIGLNPSTANDKKNDRTISRVTDFARDWGCGGFYMMNLFAFVTPYPQDLPKGREPGEAENDEWIEKVNLECDRVCLAWGAFGQVKSQRYIRERASVVAARYPGAYCLGRTKGGHPCHPLFLPGSRKPEPFKK